MATHVIEQDILIDAPVEVVWDIVTEPAHITHWFSESIEIDLRPGGAGTLTFPNNVAVPVRVEAVDRPHLFAFRWSHQAGEAPHAGNSVLVEFSLHAEGAGTRLRVVESGVDALDWTEQRKDEYTADHVGGWAHHLGELTRYASSLRGTPTR